MSGRLPVRVEQDFLQRGFSRRQFGRIAALLGAGVSLPFYGESALAQLSSLKNIPADAIRLNANENPLGPAPEAIEAIQQMLHTTGRYSYGLTDELRETLANQEGLQPEQVQPFAGSSAPLTQAVLAFTSPTRSFVTADPGYEAGERAARFIGAKVTRVPLTPAYAHDVRAMAAADSQAGIIYVCNPNNPTGSATPDAEIDWLADNLPEGSILLLDEAYTHIAGTPLRSDLVRSGKNVVILRTFSKIYGMAGLRAGAALGRPELLEKITQFSSGALPTPAMAAAVASLKSPDLVPQRRKLIGEVRKDVLAFLEQHGFSYVPSVSNKFMVDVRKPGGQVIEAMRQDNVYVGRVWPSWPTHVRVSLGTPAEMEKFKQAFLKAMA